MKAKWIMPRRWLYMNNRKLTKKVRKKLGMSNLKTNKSQRVKPAKLKVQTPIKKSCCGKGS